jgi:hypothetical protein
MGCPSEDFIYFEKALASGRIGAGTLFLGCLASKSQNNENNPEKRRKIYTGVARNGFLGNSA